MSDVLARRLGVAMATLSAGRGRLAALSAAMDAALGIALPNGPAFVEKNGIGMIGISPGRFTVVADIASEALTAKLTAIAGQDGSVCDQSDASAVFALSGAKMRDCLAKLANIDLDAAAFKDGCAAVTPLALIGATLWCKGDTIFIAVARSYENAFAHALSQAAAEYGFVMG